MRQLVFDIVFASENVILLAIALNSNITELRENRVTFAVVLLGFTLVGLILKCVYYRYLHIWAWLIMDYITKKEDGHWMCIIYSNMYLWGNLKERELLLCCVPRPIVKALTFLCGERQGTSCTVCGAIVSVFLVPIGVVVAIVILAVVLIAATAFLPFFLVCMLPCAIFLKCRDSKNEANHVIKIYEGNHASSGVAAMPLMEKNMNNGSRNATPKVEEELLEEDEDKHNNAVVVEQQPQANHCTKV